MACLCRRLALTCKDILLPLIRSSESSRARTLAGMSWVFMRRCRISLCGNGNLSRCRDLSPRIGFSSSFKTSRATFVGVSYVVTRCRWTMSSWTGALFRRAAVSSAYSFCAAAAWLLASIATEPKANTKDCQRRLCYKCTSDEWPWRQLRPVCCFLCAEVGSYLFRCACYCDHLVA